MSEETWAAPVGLMPGARVAGYVLEEQIGQGGMAVVFRARDERLDRQVALKFLAPWLATDEEFRRRFDQESRLAAAVNNPHIIPVFRADEADGLLFIAMLYVTGGDVGSLVHRQGALPPGRAVEIVSQVASALDAAHRRGLVHRDVKPSNMLLDGDSEPDHVYLSDFGLAKTATGTATNSLTRTGQLLGTLAYIAPEQVAGKPVDGRTDQYSLACAAYEMLSGEPPFDGDAIAVLAAHMNQPPPALTSRQPRLPAAVDAVFARALAKDPAGRYPSCRQFADALRGALYAAPPTQPIPPGPFPLPPPPPPPHRRRTTGIIAAAVAAVAAVGLVIWAPWSVRSLQPPTALTAGAATTNSVTLRWSDPSSGPAPSQYEVWQNGVAIGAVSGNADSYQAQGLDPDTTYHYRVQAIRGSNHSAMSAALAASTQTPPLSAAQIEGPWQVKFAVVTASSHDAFFKSEGETWTVQWTFSPDCTAAGCVGMLSGYIYGSNGFANAIVDRRGDDYVAYANVNNIEFCDYGQYGTGHPTDDEITIEITPTRAQAEGKTWKATAWGGTFTMLSLYNQVSSTVWCPEYTVEADVSSPSGS